MTKKKINIQNVIGFIIYLAIALLLSIWIYPSLKLDVIDNISTLDTIIIFVLFCYFMIRVISLSGKITDGYKIF